MSHLALRQKLGTFRTTSSLPVVLWPHRLSRAPPLSIRQCYRFHDRSRTCLRICFRQARQARRIRPTRTPCLCRSLDPAVVLPACTIRMSTSASAELPEAPPVRGFLWRFQFVLTCTFRRIRSALTGHSNRRFQVGEFVSPVQIVFEPLRVHRIFLHPCGNPGSTFLRERLSDHQTTPCSPTSLQIQTPSSS